MTMPALYSGFQPKAIQSIKLSIIEDKACDKSHIVVNFGKLNNDAVLPFPVETKRARKTAAGYGVVANAISC